MARLKIFKLLCNLLDEAWKEKPHTTVDINMKVIDYFNLYATEDENLNYSSSSGKTNSPDFLKDFMNHLNSLNVSSNTNIDANGRYFFFCNIFPIYNRFSSM